MEKIKIRVEIYVNYEIWDDWGRSWGKIITIVIVELISEATMASNAI